MTAVTRPTAPPSFVTTALQVAGRTRRQLVRSPQVLGIAVVQAVVFLLMFRYVIGGAIGIDGVPYVDFLVPGFVVGGLLFTAGGSAVAVAEDAAGGVHDRLRSLPVADVAVLTGRVITDTGLTALVALVTIGVGVLVGFRPDAGAGHLLLAAGLVLTFSFAIAWLFLYLGLVAGSAQAAQALGIIGVPFSFLSSAFVPVDTMPAALEWFARYQPLSFMVDAVRGLTLGPVASEAGGSSLASEVVGSLLWSAVLVLVAAVLAARRYRRR
jgi:ABC transporter DrrB family efflux protein